MIEIPPFTQTNAQSLTPVTSSRVDNVLVVIAPELDRPLFQFISAVDVR